jgi:general secretion pathway protein H
MASPAAGFAFVVCRRCYRAQDAQSLPARAGVWAVWRGEGSRGSRRVVGRSTSEAGFTLLEIICVVAIVAALAAVALPRLSQGTSRPRLEAYAIEVASLLKADRIAAIKGHAPIATSVSAATRSIRSGSTGRVVTVPDDVAFQATLPQRCNQRPALATIDFFTSGMSCGGAIALTRAGVGYQVRVNWLTGGTEVVAYRRP